MGPFPCFFNLSVFPRTNIKRSSLEADRAGNQLYFYFSFPPSFSFLNVSKKKMCSQKEEDGEKIDAL